MPSLPSWLRPPIYADPDQHTRSRNVFLLSIITLISVLITGARNTWVGTYHVTALLALELLVVLAIVVLNHRGWTQLAAALLTGSLVVLTTVLLFLAGQGSHDPAILVYPCALVLTGLLLDWRALALVTVVAVLGLTGVVSAEINGFIVNRYSFATRWGDLSDLAVILTGTAIIVGIWAAQFRRSLRHAREGRTAVEKSNRELATQADRLAAAAAEWQATFDSVNAAVFVLDRDWRVLRANRSTTRIVGESPAATVGRLCWEVVLGVTRPPPDYPSVRLETSGRREMGEFSVRDRTCEIVVDPLFNEAGELRGAVHLVTDITDRKRAELELRESEARHRAILENSLDGLIVIDAGGKIVEFNAAAETIFGLVRERVIDQPIAELIIPPAMREKMRRGMLRFHAGMPSTIIGKRVEMPALRADGSEFRVELAIVPVVGVQPQLFAGVVRDITERLKLEQQLRQAQKMQAIGQLAGGVAHDFNNQLASVMGFAEILSKQLHDDRAQRYADNILKATRRAADLTQKLLAFSRKGKYVAMAVDLHEIIGEVITLLQHSLDKRILIRQQFEAPRATTHGDPNQLQNAFLNLAINARDAMPHGGLLEFATAEIDLKERARELGLAPGSYLRVAVRDTGIGMDEETRKHLFEPFFTTKKEGKGTGLGLAAVYGTVKNHQGAIQVETDFGHGTTFQVYLPLRAETPAAEPAGSAILTPVNTSNAQVLIVDDEESVRGLVAEMLQQRGYRTVEFGAGQAALAYYADHHAEIDLVILDMVMPSMSGRDTFAAMRRIHPKVKALLASGYSIDGEAQSILDEGVLGFVQKPFTLAELTQAVEQALAGRT